MTSFRPGPRARLVPCARRVSLRRVASTSLAAAAALLIAAACGSRTGLLVPGIAAGAPHSSAFCVHSSYAGGSGQVTLLVLLDRSLSMGDSGKWAAATAALSEFVQNPGASGIALGLQYMPVGEDDCAAADYAKPAVAVGLLPGNATAVQASLARTMPGGDTPMTPALTGVMQYARAQLIADPSRNVAIAMITDGQPDTCDSTTQTVAQVASAGASGSPPVLTFTIGLENGFLGTLDVIAAAGGTGQAIAVDDPATAAQQLVDALSKSRDSQKLCQYAVPPVGSAPVTAADLAVSVTSRDTSSAEPYFASQGACGGADGFTVDDASKPTRVQLCPALCNRVHASSGTSVEVTAGCGAGAPDGSAPTPPDGGGCSLDPSGTCVASCASQSFVNAICVEANWVCPAGSVDSSTCATCPPVPAGCCGQSSAGQATIVDASCIDGAWVCPPGTTSFGSGSCHPPAVCGSLLPCALGQYCAFPDDACGSTALAGTCKPVPGGCGVAGPAVCGCDGQVHSSACAASLEGVDLSANRSCDAPSGTFACGAYFCGTSSQLCEDDRNFANPIPDAFSCVAPPAGCPTGCGCHACPACPAGHTCKEVCTTDSSGGRHLTCNVM